MQGSSTGYKAENNDRRRTKWYVKEAAGRECWFLPFPFTCLACRGVACRSLPNLLSRPADNDNDVETVNSPAAKAGTVKGEVAVKARDCQNDGAIRARRVVLQE